MPKLSFKDDFEESQFEIYNEEITPSFKFRSVKSECSGLSPWISYTVSNSSTSDVVSEDYPFGVRHVDSDRYETVLDSNRTGNHSGFLVVQQGATKIY